MLVKLTLGLLGREQPEIAARKSVRYIAAQGPGEETTPLFWEMIWQQVIRGQFKQNVTLFGLINSISKLQ